MADTQPTPLPLTSATVPPTTQPATLPIDPEVPEKPKKIPRSNPFKKRLCWVFTLLGLILPLLIILPLVYVAYPKALCRAVRSSNLNVTFMSILDPVEASAEITMLERLWTKSSHHAKIYSHNQRLYNNIGPGSQPFATVRTMKTKAGNNSTIQAGPKRVNITNQNEFTKFVHSFITKDEFTFFLQGSAKVRKGGLPKYDVPYVRAVNIRGLNGLETFKITEFNLQQNMLSDAHAPIHNARGKIYILNPSVMLIELGNVTLSLHVGDTSIGTATIPDFRLQPGHNHHQMYANLDKTAVATMVKATQQRTLPVDFKDMKSTFQGQAIPYFNDVLQTRHKKVQLHIPDGMI